MAQNKKGLLGINWSVRLKNPQFLVRTAIAIVLPALAYLGIQWETALESWQGLGESVMNLLSSPAALGIIALNIINLVPDPTHNNIRDTKYILNRESANVSRDIKPSGLEEVSQNDNEENEENVLVDSIRNSETDTEDEAYMPPEDKEFPTEEQLEESQEAYKDIKFKG